MFWLLFFAAVIINTDALCDANNGPVGETQCVLIRPQYNAYQWATCLSAGFIRQESNGDHYCLDGHSFCYYQCMVEFNSQQTGDVYQNCACLDSDAVPQYSNISLPSWCYMPNRTDCLWYQDCFNKKYDNCSQVGDNGIMFHRSLCGLSEEYKYRFSSLVKYVLENVKSCLQVEMVRVLRPWVMYQCEEIKQLSLTVTRNCLTYKNDLKNSMCDVDMNNFTTIVITLNEDLYKQNGDVDSINEMIHIKRLCERNGLLNDIGNTSILRMEVTINPHPTNTKTKVVLDINLHLATEIVKKLSEMIHWRRNQLSWHAWESPTIEKATENKFDIYILLASKDYYDLNYHQSETANKTVNDTVHTLASSIAGGMFVSMEQYIVSFNSLDACADLKCRHIYLSTDTTEANDYCPEENFQGINWWKTAAEEIDTKDCPVGYRGTASRKCSATAKWEKPVFINCVNQILHTTTEKVEELENITDPVLASSTINSILAAVENSSNQADVNKPMTSGDLVRSTEIIQSVIRIGEKVNASVNSEVVGNVLDSVLKPENAKNWNEVNDQGTKQTDAANIMRIVEDLGILIQRNLTQTETSSIIRNNIVIEVSSLRRDLIFPGQSSQKSHLILADQPNLNGRFFTAALYKTISNILPNAGNSSVGSDVMSISFDRRPVYLNKNISILFERNKQIDIVDPEVSCGYWNFSKRAWSYDGCFIKHSDAKQSTCECNHLTNFAILMSPATFELSDDHLKALEIITYVGCGLSILGCFLTIVVYFIFWRYVKNEWAVILMHLCIALVIGYSVFISATEETDNDIACNIITGILHYIFLVVFFLMLCEGISVVVSVTVVFKKSSKLPIYLSLAWTVPLVIVGVTMGISKLRGYHSNRYCWLNTDNFVFMAFVGPAIGVILVNIIAIVLVLRAIYSSSMMANEKLQRKARAGIKCMVTLLPVLGLSWLFGVLSFNEDTIVFQYLFGITTSCQGIFIFIFHIVFNKKVHEGFRKAMHKRHLMAQSHVSSRPKSSGSKVLGSQVNSTDTTKLKDIKISTPSSTTNNTATINMSMFGRSKAYEVTATTS